jgi:hypothetical protein
MSEWAVNPVNPLIMQIRVHRFREQICLINVAGMGRSLSDVEGQPPLCVQEFEPALINLRYLFSFLQYL